MCSSDLNTKLQKEYDKRGKERQKPEVPEGGWPGAGRPKEPVKYNTHRHVRGYDPLGAVAWKNAYNERYKPKNKKVLNENEGDLLDENNLIQTEI